MRPAETPAASLGKPFGIIKLLAALIVLAAACAFIIQDARREARNCAAMKAIEEANRSIAEIQQNLLEIQSRK